MDVITCILIDDEVLALETLVSKVLTMPILLLKGSFSDPEEAMAFLKKETVDLIITDIEMPVVSGINFIRNMKSPPFFIVVSAHNAYALEGIALGVIDYLVKPLKEDEFHRAVGRTVKAVKAKRSGIFDETHITIKDRNVYVLLDVSEILYLEAMGNYTKVVTADKNYSVKKMMKDLNEDLPQHLFLRNHKSYIVNLQHVQKVGFLRLYIKDHEKVIPIGYNYKVVVYKKLGFRQA